MVLILEYFVQLRLGLVHIVDDDLAALHVALQFSIQILSKNSRFSRQKITLTKSVIFSISWLLPSSPSWYFSMASSLL
jgi:hypothetical protein